MAGFIILIFFVIIFGLVIGLFAGCFGAIRDGANEKNIIRVTHIHTSGKHNTFEVEYKDGKIKTETVPAGSYRFNRLLEISRTRDVTKDI